MKLPKADSAFIDNRKLLDYALSLEHPRGRHKARVFSSALGITVDNIELLRSAIIDAIRTEEAMQTEQDEYGQRYRVDFSMSGPAGQRIVRTTWIIRRGEDFPRLTSCYVLWV